MASSTLDEMATKIPIVDFAQSSIAPDTVAKELLQACADWGMFIQAKQRISRDLDLY